MSVIRRLDHVALVVRSTDEALEHFSERLGLRVHSSEELPELGVRLTYLDVGNAYLQLVEPTSPSSPLAEWLDAHGEGLHHICFGVDDVASAVEMLADAGTTITLGRGRGRTSAFAPIAEGHGVAIECTEFDHSADVEQSAGWLSAPT